MDKNLESERTLILGVVAISFFLIVFPLILLLASGTITLSVSGFAVDKSERIYVGETNKIAVYEDGILVNEISPKTSRSYIFTINQDDHILLSTSDKIYIMDLNGNVLEQREDKGADIYNQLSYRKKQFVSTSGDVYKLKDGLGRTRIVKNDEEIVYSISELSYAVKIAGEILLAFALVLAVWSLVQRKRGRELDSY